MIQSHPYCEQPDPNTKIWRYMGFTKLAALLQDCTIYLPNLAALSDPKYGDPLEGVYPEAQIRKTRANLEKQLVEVEDLDMRARARESLKSFESSMEMSTQQLTYISCWHMSDWQSAAMWRLYSDGDCNVAIQTTSGILAKLLPETVKVSADDAPVFMGKVNYIDPERESVDELGELTVRNTIKLALAKRISFLHEKELRVLVLGRGLFNLGPDSKPPAGISIPIEPKKLIQKIYISPISQGMCESVVGKFVDRLGLKIPVEKSQMFSRDLR